MKLNLKKAKKKAKKRRVSLRSLFSKKKPTKKMIKFGKLLSGHLDKAQENYEEVSTKITNRDSRGVIRYKYDGPSSIRRVIRIGGPGSRIST